MEDKKQLGQLIRVYRENKKMSREQLAEKCKVTDKCICNIELGKSEPKLSTAIRIFSVLEMDITMLKEFVHIGGDEETI